MLAENGCTARVSENYAGWPMEASVHNCYVGDFAFLWAPAPDLKNPLGERFNAKAPQKLTGQAAIQAAGINQRLDFGTAR